MTLGEMLLDCPARRTCPLALEVPLDHFNPTLPLEPGRYVLRLRVFEVGFARQQWTDTLPDI